MVYTLLLVLEMLKLKWLISRDRYGKCRVNWGNLGHLRSDHSKLEKSKVQKVPEDPNSPCRQEN